MVAEITELLVQARAGEPQRLAAVFQALYPELHRIAVSRAGGGRERTLTPTVLVNELYLRLSAGGLPALTDRRHFYVAAAQAMRWILVDHARRGDADKRGGGLAAVTLDESLIDGADRDTQVLALHEGLEALEQVNPQQRQVVELRYFAGLGFAEIAELLGCSERTAKREWERARAFLYSLLMS